MFLRGRFSVLNPEMKIFSLAVSASGSDILFSSDARFVHMLDDEGRLKWEVFFEGLPVTAELSADGSYIAVGTDIGGLHFMSREGRLLWEKSFGGPVEKVALAPKGGFMAVSVKEDEGSYRLYGLNKWGAFLWEKETGPLAEIYLFGEKDTLYYLEKNSVQKEEEEKKNTLTALREKEILWEKKASLADVSGDGRFAALYDGKILSFYALGEIPTLLWEKPLGQKISYLKLTENAEQIFAYSAFPGTGSNLFVFQREGHLCWDKKIPSGSLLQLSRFGERLVASSWQEYSEDLSKVLVLDNAGNTLQEIELASRIEKLSLSQDGNILALAGSEGNIFILDIPSAFFSPEAETPGEAAERPRELYRPVTYSSGEGERFITLYFYDEYAVRLIPVSRSIKNSSPLLQAAVSELVKGPSRVSGLSRTIPKDAHIEVSYEDGIVTVDLPAELNELSGGRRVEGIIESLILTVSQFPSVEGIRFLVGGKKARSFGAEGFIIEGVFPSRPAAEGKTILYLPYRSGERYFLLPREVVPLGNTLSTPWDLLQLLLQESGRYLKVVPEVKEISFNGDEIILDWDASFLELFPPEASAKDKSLAALFIDAVLLTLCSNYRQKSLVFYVEGELWEPPADYTLPELTFKFPFYINPE